MSKVTKIALTGGPCAGKTSVIEAIEKEFGGQVILVPEVATQLVRPVEEGGVGIPGVDVEWSQEWQDNLQKLIVDKQINDETKLVGEADLRDQPSIVLCDRGVLDGAAYLAGGREEFMKKFNLKFETCASLYDQVIHLNSLAVDDPEKYEELLKSNPSRFEPVDRAAMLDEALFRVWEGHPNHKRFASTDGMETKIELVIVEIHRNLEQLKTELDADLGSEGKPKIS